MGFQPLDVAADLAAARGGRGPEDDSDSRHVRGRIAAVVWLPGLGGAAFVYGWTGSWAAGAGVVVLTLVAMVAIAFGPRRVIARLRRMVPKPG